MTVFNFLIKNHIPITPSLFELKDHPSLLKQ